ncbi:MAG TPA: pyridoxal-phosphate dependent enzyme [Planctomycetes bacterium]|nr:pyridoxal-phosphate dependent enzyme [Planctomycetota bacterium]HIK82952.1 pyridoxal-phosphate dependent enzyme [Planctomycetota bacterium]
MKIYDHILETVGGTPLVRFHRISRGLSGTIVAKLEAFNPGGSVKDRIAVHMIDAAEREGTIQPGGTIVECTSGNTGLGLALIACIRGYKAVFTMPDKVAEEKSKLLRAFGAEVLICPTAVEPDDPRSYYSVAKKITEETENSFCPNQYFNQWNPHAHYVTTGPEIWDDTDGKVTHLVAGMGTGGTISGIGKYLKEQNPEVQVIGGDPVGSLYKEYFETGVLGVANSYKTEGIGEDMIPGTMDLSLVDQVIQVSDVDAFVMAQRLAREEGILSGSSAGTAVAAALEAAKEMKENDLMVVIIPDTGERYLSKVYDEDWLRRNGLVESGMNLTAGEILDRRGTRSHDLLSLCPTEKIREAIEMMQKAEVSQIPIIEDGIPVGSIREGLVIERLLMGDCELDRSIGEVMEKSFPVVTEGASSDAIFQLLASHPSNAVLVDTGEGLRIITKYDMIHSVSGRRS